MNKTNLIEITQVSTFLDCILLLFSDEGQDIARDVLTEQQMEALTLSFAVIENISDDLIKRIEKEEGLP